MDIKDYITISGMPGLYKMISQGKNVVIVENLETGQRLPAHSTNRVSSLEEIALFTDGDDKPIKEVFLELKKKETGLLGFDPKKAGSDQLREYFASVVPDYDRLKVYVSDIRKILIWYNILVASGKVDFTEPAPEEAVSESSTE